MINNIVHWAINNNMKTWKKKFPKKCMVCSYYKLGYKYEMIINPTPPKHKCLYNKRKCHAKI